MSEGEALHKIWLAYDILCKAYHGKNPDISLEEAVNDAIGYLGEVLE